MKYTYLLINFGAIIIPFIFSFHRAIRFDKKWSTFFPAMMIVGIVFLLWDALFTKWGVWGFNPDYLIGVNIYNLPLEEILFFICIPYACVFTYHCFKIFKFNPISPTTGKTISVVLISVLFTLGLVFYDRWYTMVTFTLISMAIGMHLFFLKSDYMTNFYSTYLVLLLPFFIVNGILTGTGLETQVVWYNNLENLGIRMLTIPVEDTFYGMLLILSIVTLFEKWDSSKISPQKSLQ